MADLQTVSTPVADRAGFESLFAEFAATYLASDEGLVHLASYPVLRAEARANYDEISESARSGALDVDRVLLQLLPWSDTPANKARGAWSHIAPAITGDLKTWFERKGWALPEDWPKTARAVMDFIQACEADPAGLPAACIKFVDQAHTKGMQSGFLSPILNALRPEFFLLINAKSCNAINHLARSTFSTRLSDYPRVNAAGMAVITELSSVIAPKTPEGSLEADVFDQFCHWLTSIKRFDFGRVGYWKVAPGEAARFWEEWKDEGYVAVGWSELGDLTGCEYADFAQKRDESMVAHPEWTSEDAVEQAWNFAHIQDGDHVLTNKGTQEVLGLGRVAGPYYFVPGVEYGHRLPVEWEDVRRRRVHKGGWRRTLIKLRRADFEDIRAIPPIGGHESAITAATFDLLAKLADNPKAAFYQAHKDDFEAYVEGPIRSLMARLAGELPPQDQVRLETQSGILSRILKNDYGKGGAWDFIWAAFYPKGQKRIVASQLFVWIDGTKLRYGFHVGEYGTSQRAAFRQHAKENAAALEGAMGARLTELGVIFGEATGAPGGERSGMAFIDWLADADAGNYTAAVELRREEVLALAPEELELRIADTFFALSPLMQQALPKITVVEPPAPEPPADNPPYSLEELASDTSVELDVLRSWKRAVLRKGQAILYGPPGTGKTFIAELLAKHLAADSNGLVELVQFHPAYSYEDFMEGIRPAVEGGQLTYNLEAGRFRDFCGRASALAGTSVLVIDEINRANLSRVMGELMYLLEYRRKAIPLAGGTYFAIPENVLLLGTMNTADRSIALVDHALRRRFAFLRLRPNFEVLRQYHGSAGFPVEPLIKLLQAVNAAIGDENYQLGITYFLDQDIYVNLQDIWTTEIVPYLEEYFFDDPKKVEQFQWHGVKQALGL